VFVDNYVKVLDNIIPPPFADSIEHKLLSTKFPWYYVPHHVVKENDVRYNYFSSDNLVESPGLIHDFVEDGSINSEHHELFYNLLWFVEREMNFQLSKLYRIRGRMSLRHPGNEHTYTGPHIDYGMPENYYSMIYYVNNSDGDTVIFDKRYECDIDGKSPPKILHRIKPKKGTFLLFDGKMYHSGNFPIKADVRVVINYDFSIV
tara:strand:+ start:46 stop:657 length:612 start_codon:yes stop_codon:yes gene_type:complete